MSLVTGYSRDTWNSGAWNSQVPVIITGDSITATSGDPTVFLGNGNIISITTNLINLNSGNITVTADAPNVNITGEQFSILLNNVIASISPNINILGEELNISVNDVLSATGTANVIITGEDLIAATVNTFAVAADGAITINTPTFEANVELNNDGIQVGTAQILEISGQELLANVGDTSISGTAFFDITGNQSNVVANNISVLTVEGIRIDGVQTNIDNGNVIITGNGTITITGSQANVIASNLKFWDPIRSNITETWTNIH